MELDRKFIMKSIMTPQWKYIYNYKDETEQLYNIEKDPKELYNLFDKEQERIGQFRERLFNWVSQSKKYPPGENLIELTPDEKEKLQNLGYIN
jgi:arylsulfatase A-like enzyme